jgi:hypothetical protein
MRIVLWIVAALTGMNLCAPPAFAWGADGHRIICAIAWDEMRESTRSQIARILGDDRREAFADSCTWADREGAVRPETRPWHYMDVEVGAPSLKLERDCPAAGCLLRAIEDNTARLRSRDADERREALLFLAHFIGDVHQPLHVTPNQFRSGSDLKGRFRGKDTDLHVMWDRLLIEDGGKPWEETAARLQAAITLMQRTTWLASAPFDWAQESYTEVRVPRVGYSAASRGFDLGDSYVAANLPTIETRLSMAGVRLARTLTRALLP